MQASQTTAQGLWLATGCGVIVGFATWFGGPFAVAGAPLTLPQITQVVQSNYNLLPADIVYCLGWTAFAVVFFVMMWSMLLSRQMK